MANIPFHFIRSMANNTVLDIENGDFFAGAHVIAYERNSPPSNNQLWRFEDVGNGQCFIVSAANPNLVLDIEGGVNQNGTSVIVYDRNYPPTDNQLFVWDNGIIRSCMPGNFALDVPDPQTGSDVTDVIIWECHGNVNQQWAIDHV